MCVASIPASTNALDVFLCAISYVFVDDSFIWSSTLFHRFLHKFGRHFLFFEDQFALRRHLFCGKMVVIFSTLKIDLVSLLKKVDPKYELAIHKLMHNDKLINFAHQKSQLVSKNVGMWKHESRDGLQFYKIDDSFIGGRHVFGIKSAAI